MIASTALRSRTISAPMPLGAPILWPESVSRVQGQLAHARPAPCRTPAPHRCGRARRRRGSARRSRATGWITPISLFTHMIETTAGRPASAASSASRSTRPSGSTGSTTSRPPRCADGVRGGEHRLVLDRADHGAHRAAVGPGRPAPAPTIAEVVRLGAAGGEDHLVGLGAHRLARPPAGPARCPPAPRGRTGGRWRDCRSPGSVR